MNSWKKAQKSQNRGKKNSVFLRFLRFFAAIYLNSFFLFLPASPGGDHLTPGEG